MPLLDEVLVVVLLRRQVLVMEVLLHQVLVLRKIIRVSPICVVAAEASESACRPKGPRTHTSFWRGARAPPASDPLRARAHADALPADTIFATRRSAFGGLCCFSRRALIPCSTPPRRTTAAAA